MERIDQLSSYERFTLIKQFTLKIQETTPHNIMQDATTRLNSPSMKQRSDSPRKRALEHLRLEQKELLRRVSDLMSNDTFEPSPVSPAGEVLCSTSILTKRLFIPTSESL
jgi:hypothetical protein